MTKLWTPSEDTCHYQYLAKDDFVLSTLENVTVKLIELNRELEESINKRNGNFFLMNIGFL